MRRVWPFPPRTPLIESLEWATDVFRAKSSEQRIALRVTPRRIFSMAHFLRDDEANYARQLMRASQGDGDFYIPDWAQSSPVGPVSSGSSVSIPAELSDVYYGDRALIWDSIRKYEVIDIDWDSNGVTGDVSNNYTNARIMPVWEGLCPDGLSISRSGANINDAQAIFILTESQDLSGSNYPSYRGHDVVTDCPVVAGSSIEDSTAYELSNFDNVTGDPEYIRSRTNTEFTFQMRWLTKNNDELFALRRWLHSRKGRQKAFWLSSYGSDLEFVSASGTTLTVYNDILAQTSTYDIEIVAGSKVYRRVTNVSVGTPNNGRPTVDLTLDSSISDTDIKRISILYCVRFDADRAEIEHNAGKYARLTMPVRQVPVP